MQSLSEHDLILKNVESLRSASKQTLVGSTGFTLEDATTELNSQAISQRWKRFEYVDEELQNHIYVFEKSFEAQQRTSVAHTTGGIEKLLESNRKLESLFTSKKSDLDTLRYAADELLKVCRRHDSAKVKSILEARDQQWNHLLSSMKSQTNLLQDMLNSFYGFAANLEDFSAWLGKTETILQYFDGIIQNSADGGADNSELHKSFKNLRSEMAIRKDMLESLNATGNQMIPGLEQNGRESLQFQLIDVNQRWRSVTSKCLEAENRENTQHEAKQLKAFNLLLQKMIELGIWLRSIEDELLSLKPLGGDVETLINQANHCQDLVKQLDEKSAQVECYLDLGQQSLEKTASMIGETATEDLRLLRATVSDQIKEMNTKWSGIKQNLQRCQNDIKNTRDKMESLEMALMEVTEQLKPFEDSQFQWIPVDEISPVSLQTTFTQTQSFEGELMAVKPRINSANAIAEALRSLSVNLSEKSRDHLDDINKKWNKMETVVEFRLNALMIAALKKIDPASENQLASSVSHPWQRVLTDAKVPYYMNHENQTTQWDHPEMRSINQSLSELNNIKFSAYRTAMKLAFLQKRLSLDKLNLGELIELFNQTVCSNDQQMNVTDIVKVLTSAFSKFGTEGCAEKVDFPLCIDLVINWLLNIYDRSRTGRIWPLSVKIALVVMCNGKLDEKYRVIFNMTCDKDGTVDQFRLGLLLQDLVQIPKQLGEAAAFGGTNVDGSVRSCFEKADNPKSLDIYQFTSWIKQEPQSVVWFPVMHRLIEAKKATHDVMCSICKKSPITGLRYRCLKCLNFDMCQSCFFLGQTAKGHNLTHPMQEFNTTMSSNEDKRDLSQVLKNKLRSEQYYKKNPRLGYLSVPSTPDVARKRTASLQRMPSQNDKSVSMEDMHSRLELYASRLAELERRKQATTECEDEHDVIGFLCQSLGCGTNRSFQLQSPMQIMMALDSDQKSELDAVMKDLEDENKALQAEYDQLKQDSRNLTVKDVYGNNNNNDDNAKNSNETTSNADMEMIAEAKLLRFYKERLEARMEILEDHNGRLNSQLQRLRQLLFDTNGSGCNLVVFPLDQPTQPAMSSSSSQTSINQQGPPSFPRNLKFQNDNMDSLKDNRVNKGEFSDLGQALDLLTAGLTRDEPIFVKEEMV